MRIVSPFAITDGNMTTNATESVAAWSSGTNYTAGQQAAYGRVVYEAIQNGSNRQPDINPDYWFVVRPTNPWAMFDDKTGTQTVRPDDLEVTVDVDGYADTVGFLNISAATLQVIVESGGVEVFNQNYQLLDEEDIIDYYEYFFSPIKRLTDIVVPLPPDQLDPVITAKFDDLGSDVRVGSMVIGKSQFIGDTALGATIGIIDYSKIEEDEFGNTFIVERTYTRRGRFTVWLTSSMVDYVYNIVSSYRATPVMVIATEKYSSTFYYGLLRECEIEIAYPKYSIMSLEVRGL